MTEHQAAHGIERDPVCGMTVDASTAKHTHRHDGEDFHFCSSHCEEKFAGQPQAYLEAKDPVCGMTVQRKTARHMARHNGERFYFCSSGCEQKFTAHPDDYLHGRPEPEPMPCWSAKAL